MTDKLNKSQGTTNTMQTAGKLQPAGRSASETGLSRPWGHYPAEAFSNPFTFMRRFMDDMDRTFGELGLGSWPGSPAEGLTGRGTGSRLWSPQVEVFERDGKLTVLADLPGMKQEDVRVNIEDDILTIEGERRQEHEESRGDLWHSERSYGSFRRSVQLPVGVDPEAVRASFEHGVLEVTMPRPAQKPKGRRIDVQSSSSAKATPTAQGAAQSAATQSPAQAPSPPGQGASSAN